MSPISEASIDYESYEVLERRVWIGRSWVPLSLIITPIVVFFFLVALFLAIRKRNAQRTVTTVYTLSTANTPGSNMASQPPAGTYYVGTVYGQPAPNTYPSNQGGYSPAPGVPGPVYQEQTYQEQAYAPPPQNGPPGGYRA